MATHLASDSARSHRIESIDILRGLVIAIMAIDHVRDFFHSSRIDPLDLTQTESVLFFTRWITHFCAPVFIFLAGLSAGMMQDRKPVPELSVFLLKRGGWLIFIELTLLSILWNFPIDNWVVVFGVIWVIGAAMMINGLLVGFPRYAIFWIGLALVLGQHMLDNGIFPANLGVSAERPFWTILHVPGYSVHGGVTFMQLYPVLAWTGVMLLGFSTAPLLDGSSRERRAVFARIGIALVLLFIIVRGYNGYGNPAPWHIVEREGFTLMSFLNVQKYPPSLSYILMTLGPAFLLLALFETMRGRLTQWFSTLGRVPFFFYIVHIFTIHTAFTAITAITGGDWRATLPGFWTYTSGGYSLATVYLVWILVVAGLYPLCAWFDRLKSSRKDWWLSYL